MFRTRHVRNAHTDGATLIISTLCKLATHGSSDGVTAGLKQFAKCSKPMAHPSERADLQVAPSDGSAYKNEHFDILQSCSY